MRKQPKIPQVLLTFKQFRQFFVINPDAWVMCGKGKRLRIVKLNRAFMGMMENPPTPNLASKCEGYLYLAGDSPRYRLVEDANDELRILDWSLDHEWGSKRNRYFDPFPLMEAINIIPGWEVTFSWIGKWQVRWWFWRQAKANARDAELKTYRNFLEDIQLDVNTQLAKAQEYIDQANRGMEDVIKRNHSKERSREDVGQEK